MTHDYASVVETVLSDGGVPWARVAERAWVAQLTGTYKLTIPVVLVARNRVLALQSFFMRRPAENAEGVYRLLLSRNARTPGVWFAIDDAGDVHLRGQVPLAALDTETFDALLGALLSVADETFNAAIELGFAGYLARDLAWRAKQQP